MRIAIDIYELANIVNTGKKIIINRIKIKKIQKGFLV